MRSAGMFADSFLQVFDYVGRSAVEPITQGISGTLFAYGVTSSGKTHTMMGTATDPGLVPRAIQELFQVINQSTDRYAAGSLY